MSLDFSFLSSTSHTNFHPQCFQENCTYPIFGNLSVHNGLHRPALRALMASQPASASFPWFQGTSPARGFALSLPPWWLLPFTLILGPSFSWAENLLSSQKSAIEPIEPLSTLPSLSTQSFPFLLPRRSQTGAWCEMYQCVCINGSWIHTSSLDLALNSGLVYPAASVISVSPDVIGSPCPSCPDPLSSHG